MDYFREEISPRVYLTALRTHRFQTGCLRAVLLAPLRRETAAQWAALPQVLLRSASSPGEFPCPVEPLVRQRGEIQCVGFRLLPPAETGTPEEAIRLLAGLFLTPETRGGLFYPGCVEAERDRLCQRIQAQDGRARMRQRLLERMCPGEAYAVPGLGTGEQAAGIHYVRLSKEYRSLLAAAPLELFYCGGASPRHVASALTDALFPLSRGEPDPDLDTGAQLHPPETAVRSCAEPAWEGPPALGLGFRLGSWMEAADPAALEVFSALWQIRCPAGQAQAAYTDIWEYADIYKGIFLLFAQTAPEARPAAQEALLAVLDGFRRGEISPEELAAARRAVALRLGGREDDSRMLEEFWLGQALMGLEYGPGEMAELAQGVTVEDLARLAGSMRLDTACFFGGAAP